jgi:hypothetical protein
VPLVTNNWTNSDYEMRKNIDMNAVDYDDDDFEKPSPEKKQT